MLDTILDMFKTVGGQSAKAHVTGTVFTIIYSLGGPGVEGFREALNPYIGDLGAMLGTAVGAYLVGHVAAWLPANKPAD